MEHYDQDPGKKAAASEESFSSSPGVTERHDGTSHELVDLEDFDEAGNRVSHGVKVKRGQLNAVQQGRYGTGPAPYGYRRGREGEKPLVVDDREAEVVRIVFREYLRTRSTGKVVDYLHSKSIYTRKGNKWSRQAVAIILSNRTYRGRVSYGDVETQGLHDPIIEPALFYKANALRERKRRNKSKD